MSEHMSEHRWNDDAALLADLAPIVTEQSLEGQDPAPAAVLMSGQAAFSWRTADSELAALSEDATPVGVRAPGTPRTLTFSAGTVTIEIELDDSTLRGQLVPGRAAGVRVEGGAVPLAATADSDGFFVLERLPPTSFRLVVMLPDGVVRTPWISDPTQ